MSLNEVNLPEITKKQFFYKLKGNVNLIYSLIILQLIGLSISLGGVGSMGSGNNQLYVSLKYYSADIVIAVTLIWIFYISFLLTTAQYRTIDFTVVGNRVSAHISNIGLLISASLFGGVTASLFSVVLRYVIYFLSNRAELVVNGFYPVLSELLLSMVFVVLYMLVVSSTGYFIGILTQIHVLFVLAIPAVFIGFARLNIEYFQGAFAFLISESSPVLFLLKVICIMFVLFGSSILISNRMEVRR